MEKKDEGDNRRGSETIKRKGKECMDRIRKDTDRGKMIQMGRRRGGAKKQRRKPL